MKRVPLKINNGEWMYWGIWRSNTGQLNTLWTWNI